MFLNSKLNAICLHVKMWMTLTRRLTPQRHNMTVNLIVTLWIELYLTNVPRLSYKGYVASPQWCHLIDLILSVKEVCWIYDDSYNLTDFDMNTRLLKWDIETTNIYNKNYNLLIVIVKLSWKLYIRFRRFAFLCSWKWLQYHCFSKSWICKITCY